MSFAITNTAGSGTISSSGTTVSGSGTFFTAVTQCVVGGVISAAGQTQQIASITTNGSLTTVAPFSPAITSGTSYTISCTITQSGTDTSLAGLAGIAGTTNDSQVGGYARYILGAMKLNITGSLTIGGAIATEREQLIFGQDATNANQAIINVASGGTLIVGYSQTYASATDAVQPITLMYQVGLNKGYNESSAFGMNTGAAAGTFLVRNGGTFTWISGTIDMWGGIGFEASSVINIGVNGYRGKPVLDYTRCYRVGSNPQNIDNPIYIYSTSLTVNGFIFISGYNRTVNQSGAGLAVLYPPLFLNGYEPRYLATPFAGSSGMATGNYTIANYSGDYGCYADQFLKTGGTSHWFYKNALNGSSFTVTGDGSTCDIKTEQDLTTTVTTPGGAAISGATCTLVDTSSVFYSAQSNGSGVASFTNVITGFHAGINTTTATPITQYFSSTDVTTQTIIDYGYLPFQNSVTLRGIGGSVSAAALTADASVTASESAAVTILASNFSVSGSGAGTITVTANSTLDNLYDAIKAWKTRNVQAQLQFPTIATLPVTASGTVLSTAMSVVVNVGITLSPGTKFNTLNLTGGATLTNSGSISTTIVITGSGTSTVITAPNILSGTFYEIYDVTTSTVVSTGTAGASGIFYRYNYTAAHTLRLRTAFYSGVTGYLPTSSTAIAAASGVTFLDSQVADSVYNLNAIDGSTVTEYTSDYVHLYIDVASGTSSPLRVYAWYCYDLMNASGMANFFGGIIAPNAANYIIQVSVINILLFNTAAGTVAFILGAALTRSDGSVPVSGSTVGSVVVYNGESVVVGVSGLTASQASQLSLIMASVV